MVLRPIFDSAPAFTPEVLPAWNVIEQMQTARAEAWWLIPQPGHAALSGEIAQRFSRDGFPKADPQVAQAIAMHDAGWVLFESDPHKPPCVHPDGRPVSFFEVQPGTFLQAWTASVDRAGEESPVGGYIVSQHFAWLGEYRLQRVHDTPEARHEIGEFIVREKQRQAELYAAGGREEWNRLLPLLQFCDLFSLYLCSGARQAVEFPQEFAAGRITARFEAGGYVLSPTPFSATHHLSLPAFRYPRTSHNAEGTSISISLR